jgi:WD40 repeat protein
MRRKISFRCWSGMKWLSFIALGCIAVSLSACEVAPTGNVVVSRSEVTVLATTATPTLVNTPTLTEVKPTRTPSDTPTHIPVVEALLNGPLVAFVATDTSGVNYVLILALDTGNTRRLEWGEGIPIDVEWRPDGCGFNVTLTSGSGIQLVTSDLRNSQSEVVFTADKRADKGFATWPALDPNEKWIAYTVLSGQQTYAGAEFQNIEVVGGTDNAPPVVLTTRGGAAKAAWSPNGEHLSYSDYDSAGVAQLYVSNPDGKNKSQLTYFTMTDTIISTIQWSPIGNAIAFAARDSNRLGSLWIVSIDSSKLTKATTIDASESVEKIWWGGDGKIIAAYARSTSGEAQKDAIYWIDPASGKILHTLDASATPDKYIAQPFPVGGVQVIGFVGDKHIIFYDMNSARFEEKQYAIDWADLTGPAESSPATFKGEAACKIR